MKHILLGCILFLALFSACRKTSCIEGIILDAKTGLPISNAYITLTHVYNLQGSIRRESPSPQEGEAGEFFYTSEYDGSLAVSEVYVPGYSPVFDAQIEDDGCKKWTIRLRPLDGRLNLHIHNESGVHDTIYAGVFNKCAYFYYKYGGFEQTDPYPLVLQAGETHTEILNTCVGDSSAVLWRFTKTGPWVGVDSVFVETADLLDVEIKY